MLPHLAGRPLTLERHPDGLHQMADVLVPRAIKATGRSTGNTLGNRLGNLKAISRTTIGQIGEIRGQGDWLDVRLRLMNSSVAYWNISRK